MAFQPSIPATHARTQSSKTGSNWRQAGRYVGGADVDTTDVDTIDVDEANVYSPM